MTTKEFFNKFKSKYLWFNLAAIFGVVALICVGVKFGIEIYTHHGESIPIPNVVHKKYDDAARILDDLGLKIVVTDTGYVKKLPADCILEQTPEPGSKVKGGHIVYVIINSAKTPRITIPDIIDNCSLREAMAKLTAMGFKVGQPQFIPGEQDWVYGILVNGRHVVAGDKVSIEEKLVIQVGNGQRDADDDIDFVDPVMDEEDDMEEVIIEEPAAESSDKDEFVEVPAEGNATGGENGE